MGSQNFIQTNIMMKILCLCMGILVPLCLTAPQNYECEEVLIKETVTEVEEKCFLENVKVCENDNNHNNNNQNNNNNNNNNLNNNNNNQNNYQNNNNHNNNNQNNKNHNNNNVKNSNNHNNNNNNGNLICERKTKLKCSLKFGKTICQREPK